MHNSFTIRLFTIKKINEAQMIESISLVVIGFAIGFLTGIIFVKEGED